MPTEDVLFTNCESIDEVLFRMLDEAGLEGLRALMNLVVKNKTVDRQHLLDAADKLEQAGLLDATGTVRHAAVAIEDQPSPDVRIALSDDNWENVRARLASLSRKGKLSPADVAYLAEHCGDELFDFLVQSKRGRWRKLRLPLDFSI